MTAEWHKRARQFGPILVVTSEHGTANGLSVLLRGFGPMPELIWAGDAQDAWRRLQMDNPKLIFVEQLGRIIDGLPLIRRLRRSDLSCRCAPVVVLSNEATVAAMRAAQASGASEFLVRPFSAADLGRRLDAICAKDRVWVETGAYIGPDRRRFKSDATGRERRHG